MVSEGVFFEGVGIGASAGGLDAFTQLLRALPAETGMAFVLIQHLDPLPSGSSIPTSWSVTSRCRWRTATRSSPRSEPSAPTAPAAALTALAGDADRKRPLASGFQLHLTKPVDLDLLSAPPGRAR